MMVSRGEIWLANLNPTKKNNEMGKVRPVLIYQNDELNHNNYPTTIIIPLTTKLIDNTEPIRMRIKSKDKLKDDSDLVITHIRAIDNSRFMGEVVEIIGHKNDPGVDILSIMYKYGINDTFSDEVLKDPRCKVLEQVRNGVAIRAAILKKLILNNKN